MPTHLNYDEQVDLQAGDMYMVTRPVTPTECPWLGYVYLPGDLLRRFRGVTYGCISPDGVAIHALEGGFMEFPKGAVVRLNVNTEVPR